MLTERQTLSQMHKRRPPPTRTDRPGRRVRSRGTGFRRDASPDVDGRLRWLSCVRHGGHFLVSGLQKCTPVIPNTDQQEDPSARSCASTTGSASPRCASSAPTVSRSASSASTTPCGLAQESDLDLVEVAPTARPPVCKLMDYGKFKYENAQKARESRRNQTNTVIKEMKLRPKIDPHDYETKKGHVVRFLKQGDKVKITIMFRGREQHRPELGFRLLQRLAGDVEELGFVESAPKQDGRNMIMVLGPHKKKSEAKAEAQGRARRAGRRPSRGSPRRSTRSRSSTARAAAEAAQVRSRRRHRGARRTSTPTSTMTAATCTRQAPRRPAGQRQQRRRAAHAEDEDPLGRAASA